MGGQHGTPLSGSIPVQGTPLQKLLVATEDPRHAGAGGRAGDGRTASAISHDSRFLSGQLVVLAAVHRKECGHQPDQLEDVFLRIPAQGEQTGVDLVHTGALFRESLFHGLFPRDVALDGHESG